MATIILTGGGTAGHCTPNLALLPYLKNHFDKIYYIGSKNGIEKEIIQNAGIKYYSVSTAKFNRKSIKKNIKAPFKILSGIIGAKKLIKKLKPDIIFSKGGYVSVPTVIAGRIKNIPIVSHESDYTLGLANKITAKYCNKVLTSFPETAKNLKNGIFVGPPLRKDLFDKQNIDKNEFGFYNDKPVLLVTGGSQGSKIINQTLRQALPNIIKNYNVIHICGKGNLDNSINFNGYFQTEYMSNIKKAYSVTSVCVSRCGANTSFELIALKIPCVFIPLPKGVSRGDQVLNAEYFSKLGLSFILYQNQLNKDSLIEKINDCYNNKHLLSNNFKKHPFNNSNEIIVKHILNELRTN